MIAIIGYHGIRTTSTCVSRPAFSFGFIQSDDGLTVAPIWTNGRLDLCKTKFHFPNNPNSHSHQVELHPTRFSLSAPFTSVRKSELTALVAASFLGMPGGCLIFIPFYHPLHDFYKVPSNVTSITILLTFTAIVWRFDRKSNRNDRPKPMNLVSKVLIGHLIGHYVINLATAILFNPEDVISIGLHQTIGNCNETQPVHTVLKTLSRKRYLCVDDYDEAYYDFHCVPSVPKEGSIWYTICGTPFE